MDSLIQNAMSTALGTTETAKISIMDDRDDRSKELSVEKAAAIGGFGSFNAIGGQNLLKALGNAIGVNVAGSKYGKQLTVQFNPSSIRLESHVGDDDAQKYNFTNNETGIGHGAMDLHVEMTVKLIFDKVANNMAFTQDALNASTNINAAIGAAAGAGKDMAGALLGGAQESVQVTVEAFIAALRNSKTRHICFDWGELHYEGVLNRLNTTYTMFDILGRPTRAEVEMTMYLADPSVDDAADSESKKDYWRRAYYAAFVDGGSFFDTFL